MHIAGIINPIIGFDENESLFLLNFDFDSMSIILGTLKLSSL